MKKHLWFSSQASPEEVGDLGERLDFEQKAASEVGQGGEGDGDEDTAFVKEPTRAERLAHVRLRYELLTEC